MTPAKAFLLFGAVVFLGIGVMFLAAPVYWGSVVEIPLPTAMARTDFMATYGGLDFAVGVFLGISALRTGWVRPGLLALGLAAAGFCGGRLLGILVEGTASPLMLAFAAIEATSAAVAFYLLRNAREE